MKSSLLLTILLPGAALTAPVAPSSGHGPGLAMRIRTLLSSISSPFSSSSFFIPRATPYDTNANELTDGTPCRDVTLIYARGTTQKGNIGVASDVGPLMINNVSALIGAKRLAVQGVDYAANIKGFLGNLFGVDDSGGQTMADLVSRASTQCPATKIVISGYSQGNQLGHTAVNKLGSSAALKKVAAVVMFGDPNNSDPVGNIAVDKVKRFCHDGDNICAGGLLVLPPHLNYQIDAKEAAQFIASKVV